MVLLSRITTTAKVKNFCCRVFDKPWLKQRTSEFLVTIFNSIRAYTIPFLVHQSVLLPVQ